jgi:hypothetical protein
MASHVVGNGFAKALDETGTFRARPDQTHITFEDVEQLRSSSRTGSPQQCSEPRPSRVVGPSENRAGLLLGVNSHGAEFQHLKSLAIQATNASCRYSTGPRLVSLIMTAISSMSGESRIIASSDSTMSHEPFDDAIQTEIRDFRGGVPGSCRRTESCPGKTEPGWACPQPDALPQANRPAGRTPDERHQIGGRGEQ